MLIAAPLALAADFLWFHPLAAFASLCLFATAACWCGVCCSPIGDDLK